jgi:DNA-binding response OmpR family regulator
MGQVSRYADENIGDLMRLLVVEDDRALGEVVRRGLVEDGHAVDLVTTLAAADQVVYVETYDLVLLDLGLPDGDGAEFCRQMRAAGNHTKVLMLTARDALSDKVGGLDAGADDYLTKPFQFPELSARVRALLRRSDVAAPVVLEIGQIRLDPAAHAVWRGPAAVPLTPKEFALLHYLMVHRGHVVTRTTLLDHVWDMNYDGLSNVVDVHVANLRRKLELPGADGVIETVRGVGYRLNG